MKTAPNLFEQIIKNHDDYRKALRGSISDPLPSEIDALAFHLIEEIIEMRRTYPHKYWKKFEQLNVDEMIEETADIFLMNRSLYKAVCDFTHTSEEKFLEKVLEKIQKNKRRLHGGQY